jgi:hypothetical protein
MYDHDSSLIGGPEHGSSTPTYAATPPRRMRPTAFLLQLEALDLCNEMLVLPRRSVRKKEVYIPTRCCRCPVSPALLQDSLSSTNITLLAANIQ